MKKIYCLGVLLVIISVMLMSCNTLSEEELFLKTIEELPVTDSAHYVYIENVHELLSKSNHTVVKCKVKSRLDSKVIDNFGVLDNSDLQLSSTRNDAIVNIKTPYQLEILDVYLGENVNVGDVINFNARYGYIDSAKYSYKVDNYPLLEVGGEYILFLSSKIINDTLIYYFSFPPGNALKIDSNNNTFACVDTIGETVFDEYDLQLHLLEESLRTLVKNNNYDCNPVVISQDGQIISE